MTRDELVTQVETFLNRTDKTTFIRTMLNWVQQEIARQHPWSCLLTTTTGTFTAASDGPYSWPSDLRELYCFRITTTGYATELVPLSAPYVYKAYSEITTSGTPIYFYELGPSYYLIPSPGSAYTHEMLYGKWPAALSTNVASDLTNMDDLLVYYTCYHMCLSLGLLEDAQVYATAIFSEYPIGSKSNRGLLAQARAQDNRRSLTLPIKRPFTVRTSAPLDYLTDPFYGHNP